MKCSDTENLDKKKWKMLLNLSFFIFTNACWFKWLGACFCAPVWVLWMKKIDTERTLPSYIGLPSSIWIKRTVNTQNLSLFFFNWIWTEKITSNYNYEPWIERSLYPKETLQQFFFFGSKKWNISSKKEKWNIAVIPPWDIMSVTNVRTTKWS